MDFAARHPPLHWLVVKASVLTNKVSSHLINIGHTKKALPYVLHAVLVMEVNVALRRPQYLAWRCQLASTACRAFDDLGLRDCALKLLKRFDESVSDLHRILKLDPVPLPKAVKSAIKDAEHDIHMLELQFALRGAAAADVTSALSAAKGDSHRTVALLRALAIPGRRALQTGDAPESLRGTLEVLNTLLFPRIEAASKALEMALGRADETPSDLEDRKVKGLKNSGAAFMPLTEYHTKEIALPIAPL
jgi:hypothetical protein